MLARPLNTWPLEAEMLMMTRTTLSRNHSYGKLCRRFECSFIMMDLFSSSLTARLCGVITNHLCPVPLL